MVWHVITISYNNRTMQSNSTVSCILDYTILLVRFVSFCYAHFNNHFEYVSKMSGFQF
jgi:hypothetical protein